MHHLVLLTVSVVASSIFTQAGNINQTKVLRHDFLPIRIRN